MAPRVLLAQGCWVSTQPMSRVHARTLARGPAGETQHSARLHLHSSHWANFQLHWFIPLEQFISPDGLALPQYPGGREASAGEAAEPWLLVDAHEAQGSAERTDTQHPTGCSPGSHRAAQPCLPAPWRALCQARSNPDKGAFVVEDRRGLLRIPQVSSYRRRCLSKGHSGVPGTVGVIGRTFHARL